MKRPLVTKESLTLLSDIGLFDPYLPPEEVWIVYAKLPPFHGWAIVGAKSQGSARYYTRKPGTGWVTYARITLILNIKDSAEHRNIPKLKEAGPYPKEHGEWKELEWIV